MRWFPRLLSQGNTLHALAKFNSNHGTRKRHKRGQRALLATPDYLEHRRLLSNVQVGYNNGALTIQGDAHGDSFAVIEGGTNGTVTVESTASPTLINGFTYAYTSPGPVSSIAITLPGGGAASADNVSLSGPATGTQPIKSVSIVVTGNVFLTFDATNVHNSGTFSLTTDAKLDATVDDSSFSSLSITQTGICCATVDLVSDTVPGRVTVSEGNGNYDSITATDDAFGATVLTQGAGNYDAITVDPSKVLNLTITQGNGNYDSIDVDTVQVSNASFGVVTTQGSGLGDTTYINAVTGYGSINNPTLPSIPSISVTQKDVYSATSTVGDTAIVSNSDVAGYIAITQGQSNLDFAEIYDSVAFFEWASIFQGSGNSDFAEIYDVDAGGYVSITQGNGGISLPPNGPDFTVGDTAYIIDVVSDGYVSTTQGNGVGDYALDTDVFAYGGGITITQGNGDGDYAAIAGDFLAYGPVGIVQGNGDGDTAVIDPGTDKMKASTNATGNDNGIYINQGNGDGDTAVIQGVYAPSLFISQGNGVGDSASILGGTSGYSSYASSSASISQGSGSYDSATISGVYVGYGSLTITQADVLSDVVNPNTLVGDVAIINYSEAPNGNITVTQGDAPGDIVWLYDDLAGSVEYDGPYAIDFAGDVTVTQGNGYNDQVYLNSYTYTSDDTTTTIDNTFNNVSITQGDNLYNPSNLPNCPSTPGLGDVVSINDTYITSDLTIVQGDSNAVGGYTVLIGDESAVFVGGYTSITQNGANNTDIFGGADDPSGIDFQTSYLDVYTGAGGGGYVQAVNTVVVFGSGLGNDFVIDGGGEGNTFVDLGNNFGVTVSPNYYYA
jgi:hypothetical protein